MCGIVGLMSTDPILRNDFENMVGALKHRGPDASGSFREKDVCLGHTRLSILDLSSEANQPMFSPDERYVIVFNGEVFNFRELAKTIKNATLKTTSDTEVILHLFIEEGVNFVNKLIGMFTIVIYDRMEEAMYLFRDRIGIKPLFYYHKENVFAFASELKSFTKHTVLRTELPVNQNSIATFLYLGYIPEPYTIYHNVFKFPAGGYAKVCLTNNEIKIKKYWSLESCFKATIYDSYKDSKADLKELINSSIQYRLIADVPVGAFLSGGIDSSLVTAVAQQYSSEKIKTFTIGFKEENYNEAKFAKQISGYLGTEHTELFFNEKDAQELISSLLDVYDEPFADSSALPTLMVSSLASKKVKVALSGDGGDELFMGYNRVKWAHRFSNFPVKPFRRMGAKLLKLNPGSRYQRVADLFNGDDPAYFKSHIFSQESYFFLLTELKDLLGPGDNKILINEINDPIVRKLSSKEDQALFDLKYYLKDDLLVKTDRASMSSGLEVRVPLLDHRIVEFALNLSSNLKIRKGVTKFLLKDILFDYIPASYFDRPKSGFRVPIEKWLSTDLKYLIDDYLSEEAVEKTNVFNYNYIRGLKEKFQKGQIHYYVRLWSLIIMQKFLMRHQAIS